MRRRGLVLFALILLAGGGALAWRLNERSAVPGPRPAAERPTLALLTSLPLLFAEQFSLQSGGSVALSRLEQHYNVVPIGVADKASLAAKPLLLMAHPRAQPAEVLVEIDEWVRAGGRLVLLADPRLDWSSSLPLGNPLRPPPAFADTGLLAHWGVTLNGPLSDGPMARETDVGEILTASSGALSATGTCRQDAGGLLVRCKIGSGTATIIADADFLNVAGAGSLDGPTERNIDFLVAELRALERR